MVTAKQRMKGHAAAKPTMDELLATRERMNRASLQFLKIDLETALTFAKIARETSDEWRMKRNRQAARKAYDTMMHLVPKVDVNADDRRVLSRGLVQLKSELSALGEIF